MTRDAFEKLVMKLEKSARKNPGLYKLRVVLLSLLGNAYLAVILVLLLALLAGALASILVLKVLAVKLVLVIGVFISMIFRALWVRLDAPTGQQVRPAEAPALFAMIDDLRRQLRAPRFHEVLITDDFNAAVVQIPRLGIFGWHRNYLLIGLPLMKTLTEEQFKAVLAHEFGHLAGGHGRMANWIYRQRLRWSRLMASLEARKSRGSFLFKPFLNWYAGYFNAYSFPLARANEYDADAVSARLTSSRAMAEALTGVDVIGSYLDQHFWPGIHRQADDMAQPKFMPFSAMGQSLPGDLDETLSRQWLEKALSQETSVDDTHPALKDRLAAIGETPRLAPPEPGSAADRLLGENLSRISRTFDERWWNGIQATWKKHYETVKADRRRLSELEALDASGAPLTLEQRLERAQLTDAVGHDAEAALSQFRQLHEQAPDNAVICYNLGTRLLDRTDDSGCALIERAMELDDDAIAPGAERLRDYHWQQGREDEAHRWHRILVERTTLLEAAHEERNRVTLKDRFDPHGLTVEALADLREQLRSIQWLGKAYLFRKRVKYLTDQPCYVLGFRVRGFILTSAARKRRTAAVIQQLQENLTFPGETIILSVDGANYRFGRKMRWRRKARVH